MNNWSGRCLGRICFAIVALAVAQMSSGQDLLPNLRAFPPSELSVVPNPDTGNPELRLDGKSWNSGDGPLELVAGATGPAGQDVWQRIYDASGGYREELAGTFVWHPAHNHFHFQEYAVYTLKPVAAPGASQRESYKTSFCIMDTTKVNTKLPGAPKRPAYATCSASVQGMSVGWGDRYGPQLPGQEIDLTGNTDGLYELTVDFDPSNRIVESDDTDNTACVLLDVSVTNQTVQTVGACGTTGGGVSVTSIEPSNAWAGTVTNVIIKGSNFSPGIAVGFENGSGPAPAVDSVTVLDSDTIAATVSVKNGGGRNSSVWDLRVGSAVLTGGFEVLR